MSEDRGVHPDCRNASNPFHQCSNYCFNFISEANKGLNTTPGTTKVKDDGFGPNPTAPLGGEGDQSRNVVVDQSTLLASSDDEDNEAGNITNLTRRQKQTLRTYKEAMKARQTATVQEKKIMEPPEEMAQEKQPAPAGRDGENFINDFLTAFPPLTYIGDKAGEEIYAPPIPVKADINAQINTEDVSKVGAYPDHVVLSIANERDKLKAQLQQVMEENTKQKTNQHRQAELWRGKYYAVANAPAHGPASHGQDSGVQE